ncbi:flavin reductase (DIM6/NTAB) family NADH-FMN oxidoreductase RutF [Bradyrhizobium sp. USDA 4354]
MKRYRSSANPVGCINRASSAYAAVIDNGVVCVNVLSARHEGISRLFGGKVPLDGRFAAAVWPTLDAGAPVLSDCAAAFDCRIIDSTNVRTHDVLSCRVVALQRSDYADCLVYSDRNYHVVRVRCPNA